MYCPMKTSNRKWRSFSMRHDTYYENKNNQIIVFAQLRKLESCLLLSIFVFLMNGRPSIDKMDTINFLLTEVSLGLLGNNLFDINGNGVGSLNLLVSKCASKNNQNTSGAVPLLQKLKLNESNFSQATDCSVQKTKLSNSHPYKKPEKLRRLSHTGLLANLTPPVDIPAKPQSAKIRERRFTCIGDRSMLTSAASQKTLDKKTIALKSLGMNINKTIPPLEKLQQDLNIGT